MVHFMLDTRSTFQKIKDWLCKVFATRPQPTETQRLLSRYEQYNRNLIFKTIRPIEPNHVPREESGRIDHMKRDPQSPIAIAVGRNNLKQYHYD